MVNYILHGFIAKLKMVIIRECTADDLDRVAYIAEVCLEEDYVIEIFMKINEAINTIFLLASHGGKTVGFISGVHEDKKSSRILMLAVLPAFRNLGTGNTLLNNYINICGKEGLKWISLEVRVTNKNAINFYKKRGFQAVETVDDFYTNGQSCLRMIKRL